MIPTIDPGFEPLDIGLTFTEPFPALSFSPTSYADEAPLVSFRNEMLLHLGESGMEGELAERIRADASFPENPTADDLRQYMTAAGYDGPDRHIAEKCRAAWAKLNGRH